MFSIIMPVFNSEKFLDKTISSIINQTFDDWELIVVNDGSTDKSLEILKKYQEQDNRIKVISQKNRGASFSRNVGIKKSSYKYTMFIDSDDWIEPNTLEICNKIIKNNSNLDLICFRTFSESINIKKEDSWDNNFEGFIKKDFFINSLFSDKIENSKFTSSIYAVSKIYKSDILKSNDLLFDEKLKYGEDMIFVLSYALAIKKIYMSNSLLYHYVINENSVTHKFDSFFSNYQLMFLNKCYNICYNNNLNHLFKLKFVQCIEKILNCYFFNASNPNILKIKINIKEMDSFFYNDFFKNCIKDINIDYLRVYLTKIQIKIFKLIKSRKYYKLYFLICYSKIIKKIKRM